MQDIIIIAALVLIFSTAIYTIIKQKKKGNKCIGCGFSSKDKKFGCSSCECNTKK